MATILVIHDDKIRQWLTSTNTTGEGQMYVYGQRDRSTGWQAWPLVPNEMIDHEYGSASR